MVWDDVGISRSEKKRKSEARDDALKDLCFCNKTDQSKYFVSYTEYILDFG